MSDGVCTRCGSVLSMGVVGALCMRCLRREAAVILGSLAQPLTQEDVDEGQRFGDFQLIEEIARGGMGVVWKARQISLDRVVAVKMLQGGKFSSPEFVHRFRAEAQAAAQLQHPNIVVIHEVGDYQGHPYFSMDYVEGSDLAQLARDRPFSPRAAAECVRVVSEAVAYAHQHGIIHRDIKPSNVLVDRTGLPRVTDFGLAKRLDRSDSGGLDGDLTLSGQVIGTPSFMPPEQAGGKKGAAGVTSDVYSLGALLYFLLTQRPPFSGSTLQETLRQVVDVEPVPPRLLRSSIPSDLQTICLKCLEKDPRRRYSTADALGEELGRFLAGASIHARPLSPIERAWRWCVRRPAVAALTGIILMLLAAGGVGVLWQWRRAELEAARNLREAERNRAGLVRASVATGQQLMDQGDTYRALSWFTEALRLDAGDPTREEPHRLRIASALRSAPRVVHAWYHDAPVSHAEFSPDGREVLTASLDHTARVWSTITGRQLARVKHDHFVNHATFAADANLFATASSDRTARVWDSLTGLPVTPHLWHASNVNRVAFSPEGRRLLTACSDGTAQLWDVFTGRPVVAPMRHAGVVRVIAFSPDGRRIATFATEENRALVWDAGNGTQVAECPQLNLYPFDIRFSADSRRVLVAGWSVVRLFDAETGRDVIPPLRHSMGVTAALFSPDGRRILTASEDRTVRVWDAGTGTEVSSPIKLDFGAGCAAFSPDGQKAIIGTHNGTAQVWSLADSRPLSPILRHNRRVERVQFSPEGRFILTAGGDGMVRLWTSPHGQPRRDLVHDASVRAVAFDRSGNLMATGDSQATTRVWETITGRGVTTIQDDEGWHDEVAFSPDGKRVVTVNHIKGTVDIWDARTGRRGISLKEDGKMIRCRLTADGSRLITLSSDKLQRGVLHRVDMMALGSISIRTWDAATGSPVGPRLLLETNGFAAELSKDGRFAAVGSKGGTVRVWHAASGKTVGPGVRPSWLAGMMGFSPDGCTLATADGEQTFHPWDGRAELWDLATGRLLGRLPHKGGVGTVVFSEDGGRVVTASVDGTARVWDSRTGAPITPPLAHEWLVVDAQFSWDGRFVATAGTDAALRLWDSATGEAVTPRLAEDGYMVGVRFSPTGRSLVSWLGEAVAVGRTKYRATIWDFPADSRAPEVLRQLSEMLSGGRVEGGGFAISDPGEARALWTRLVTTFPDDFSLPTGEVRAAEIWELEGRILRTLRFAEAAMAGNPRHLGLDEIREAALDQRSSAGVLLAGITNLPLNLRRSGKQLELLTTPEPVRSAVRSTSPVALWRPSAQAQRAPVLADPRQPVFSPDGRWLALSRGGLVVLVDSATGLVGSTLSNAHAVVGFAPDTTLVTTSNLVWLKLWDIGEGRVRDTVRLERPAKSERWTTLSPRGDRLAGGWHDGSVSLWETATGRLLTNLVAHRDRIWHMEFSPDQKRLATAGRDYTICIWDLDTLENRVIQSVAGNYSVAFSPDGRVLASGHSDGKIRLWDVATGQRLGTLKGHGNTVFDLAFSPGGGVLASASDDRTVKQWDLAERSAVLTTSMERTVNFLAFAADGNHLAFMQVDGLVGLWNREGHR